MFMEIAFTYRAYNLGNLGSIVGHEVAQGFGIFGKSLCKLYIKNTNEDFLP